MLKISTNIYFALLCFCMIILASCIKKIEFSDSNFKKELTTSCCIENNSCNLYLTSNQSILEKDSVIFINNQRSSLRTLKNLYHFAEVENQKGLYRINNIELTSGDEIELNIETDGFPSMVSKIKIPNPPFFDIQDTSWYENDNNYKNISISLLIKDEVEIPNFYIIEIFKNVFYKEIVYDSLGNGIEKNTIFSEPIILATQDNSVEIISEAALEFEFYNTEFTLEDDKSYPIALIFNDNLFENSYKLLKIECEPNLYLNAETNLEVRVTSINSEFYEFIRSIASYESSNEAFNNPVRIYSNISDGNGYFAVKIIKSKTLKIK